MQMLGDSVNNTPNLLRTTLQNKNLPPGSSRKVLCLLLSGLLSGSQPHWTPLRWRR